MTALPAPVLPEDDLGRSFSSLRISLTDRCNFACSYCVPDGRNLSPAEARMSADDFARALELLMWRGIRKLRLTGGEPLLSDQLEPLLQRIRDFPLDDLALTTNGSLLEQRLPTLVRLGVRRINLSLDSLDAQTFRRLSRGGDLNATLRGLSAAARSGLKVRVNAVLLRQQNAGEILPLLEYCAERGLELRLIELMRMGHLRSGDDWRRSFFGRDEILATIASRYAVEPAGQPADATAERFRVGELDACFGIIANSSAPFCAGCNRLRLTSDGLLYGCISSARGFSVRELLPLPDAQALAALDRLLPAALRTKSRSHFGGAPTVMKFIGG